MTPDSNMNSQMTGGVEGTIRLLNSVMGYGWCKRAAGRGRNKPQKARFKTQGENFEDGGHSFFLWDKKEDRRQESESFLR